MFSVARTIERTEGLRLRDTTAARATTLHSATVPADKINLGVTMAARKRIMTPGSSCQFGVEPTAVNSKIVCKKSLASYSARCWSLAS
jgi:hypothetical protein